MRSVLLLLPAVVVVAAWLTGCEPKPPQPKAAHAAAAPPATTAAVILSDTPVPQPVMPAEVADEESLASLRDAVGKYPYDGTNVLEHGVLADRLRALLGARYPQLLANMRTVSPLTDAGGVWFISGNRPHAGTGEVAAVVIDPAQNALRVWLLSGGESYEFVDPPATRIPWPEDLRILRQNQGQPGQ